MRAHRGLRPVHPVLVLAAAFTVPLALAGPGQGQGVPGSDAVVEATDFTVANQQAGGRAVGCPAGSRVTGGGVLALGAPTPDSIFAGYILQSSVALGEAGDLSSTRDGEAGRFWYANVFNGSGAARTFRVCALCSRTSDAVLEVTTFSGVGSANTNTGCPTGQRVLGGGIGVRTNPPVGEGPIVAIVRGSGVPAPRDGEVATLWRTGLDFTSRAGDAVATIVCSAASDAVIHHAPIDLGATTSAQAVCPAGRRAVGGGALVDPGGSFLPGLQLVGPVAATGTADETGDGDVARGWSGRVFADRAVGANVVVLCASDPPAATAPPVAPGGVPGGPAPTTGPPVGTPVRVVARCGGRPATITGTPGPDVLRGTSGPDVIAAGAGNDRILAGGGGDLVCGEAGNDTLSGGAGNDLLLGGAGRDTLLGGAGRDRLFGGPGSDRLVGGPGVDVLVGGAGRNALTQ